jgi:hypothetical protein
LCIKRHYQTRLTPVILATQEAEIRRIVVRSQPRQIVHETLSQKYPIQKGLVEWLKVYALSSSPGTTKKWLLHIQYSPFRHVIDYFEVILLKMCFG